MSEAIPDVRWTMLIFVAVFKRSLISREDMTPRERLSLLEWLDGQARDLGEPAVAAVQPASGAFVEIFREALNADDPNSESGRAFFAILETPSVHASLAALNPSINAAHRLCRQHHASPAGAPVHN